MTLYKSIQHIRATRAGGIRSIMHIVQRDQILFVLAICLINFANLVLVLQRSSWPYRLVSGSFLSLLCFSLRTHKTNINCLLSPISGHNSQINQLPAAAFTQIFLSRIIFNLKHIQKKLVSANVSPVITTLPLSPSGRIRGEFTFGISGSGRRESDGSGKDDLELGEDFKSSSLSPNSAYNTSKYKKSKKELLEEEQDNHTKADFIPNTNNVFTLRFDPTSRRTPGTPSSPMKSSHPTVPKGGRENDDDEDDDKVEIRKVNGGEMYSLGSYRLPPPTPLNEDKISPFFITPMKDPSDNVPPPPHSPHEHQKSSEEFVDPISPSGTKMSGSTVSGSTVFKPPTSPSPSYGKGQGHHQQRSSSSRRMELSPYFETPKEEKDAGLSRMTGEMPSTQHHTFNQVSSHPTLSIDTKSAASTATSAKKKEEPSTTAATRSSFETLGGGRRASTIDEHQRITDWEPPSAWGTSASPRTSPIPFTERRLSSSVARNSLSLQRSRQASTGNIVRSTDNFGAAVSRPSFENASSREQQQAADIAVVGAGAGAASSTGPGIGERQRGSACYASIFSFDNDENQLEEVRDGEDEEDGEIKAASSSSKK